MSVNKFINGQLVKLSGGGGSIATTNTPGIVKPDGTTITIDNDGTIHGSSQVSIDNDSITKNSNQQLQAVKVNGHTVNSDVPVNAVFTDTTYDKATNSVIGLVRGDGTNTSVDSNGVLTALKVNGHSVAKDVPSDAVFTDTQHTIVDENDISFTKRSKLKFINATIIDDATNDTTIVEVEGGGTTIVQKPTVTVGSYTYNGTAQGPTITGLDSDKVVVTNATKVDAGTYTLTIALKNSSTMVWNDMTTANLTYNYTIDKVTLAVPVVTDVNKTYNGSSQSPTINGFNSSTMTKTGDSATVVGNYNVVFGLVDNNNYQWSSSITSFAWSIAKASLTIPTVSGSFTYDGTQKSAVITNYDSSTMTQTGDAAGTNAGTYHIYFNLKDSDNYQWSDGTITQKDKTWSIAKANPTFSLDKNSITLNADAPSTTVTITYNGDGTLSVSGYDSSLVTVNLSNKTITITGKDVSGSTSITVSAAAGNNYNAGTDQVCNINCDYLKIVTFADGTDEEIAAMLDAYYADQISWADMGWAVGNTRKIHLNSMAAPNPNSGNTWAAQEITVVIVAHDHTDLATPINGHTKACITVQTRECMNNNTSGYNQAGHIYVNGDSSYDMSFTKWSNLYMRTYLNDKVLGAITYSTDKGSGTSFKNMIKPSKHYRHTTYNGSGSELVTDNLFLPSYPEIYGTAAFSYYKVTSPVEGTQFPYYATSSNRIKYGNNNGASNGTAQYWWNGSASSYYYSSSGYYWCYVNTDGSSNNHFGTYAYGLAPAFAM